MARLRGPGRRLHGNLPDGGPRREEGEGGVRDGHQTLEETQPSQHCPVQVSCRD